VHRKLTLRSTSLARRKIRETLNNLILKSPQDWQTGVGLPFVSCCVRTPPQSSIASDLNCRANNLVLCKQVRINGTTVEWDEMRFDVRLLQRVPVSLDSQITQPSADRFAALNGLLTRPRVFLLIAV
jgi:hypothetical protein